jgi:hypothetical protein
MTKPMPMDSIALRDIAYGIECREEAIRHVRDCYDAYLGYEQGDQTPDALPQLLDALDHLLGYPRHPQWRHRES